MERSRAMVDDIPRLFDSLSTLQAVEALVAQGVRESAVVEYKAATTKFRNAEHDIAKDVSAMANSSGGVILYGVTTDPEDKTLPVAIDGVHPANIETFDRIVNARIRPEIPGLEKRVLTGAKTVMVVHVPQSDHAPHQSLQDFCYYRRAGTEALPMEHDLVALYFGRRQSPSLAMEVDVLTDMGPVTFDPAGYSDPISIRLLLVNRGKRAARDTKVILRFPDRSDFELQDRGGLTSIDHLYEGQWACQQDVPGVVHPGLRVALGEVRFRVRSRWLTSNDESHPFMSWTLFADEMEPQADGATLTGDLRQKATRYESLVLPEAIQLQRSSDDSFAGLPGQDRPDLGTPSVK
jgi:hypothetical protein